MASPASTRRGPGGGHGGERAVAGTRPSPPREPRGSARPRAKVAADRASSRPGQPREDATTTKPRPRKLVLSHQGQRTPGETDDNDPGPGGPSPTMAAAASPRGVPTGLQLARMSRRLDAVEKAVVTIRSVATSKTEVREVSTATSQPACGLLTNRRRADANAPPAPSDVRRAQAARRWTARCGGRAGFGLCKGYQLRVCPCPDSEESETTGCICQCAHSSCSPGESSTDNTSAYRLTSRPWVWHV